MTRRLRANRERRRLRRQAKRRALRQGGAFGSFSRSHADVARGFRELGRGMAIAGVSESARTIGRGLIGRALASFGGWWKRGDTASPEVRA